MDLTYVIKKPLLTEKSTAGTEQGRYAFEVDSRASKVDIKKAIETLYKVNVVKVNTSVHETRLRPTRFGIIGGKKSKKAIVRLKDGQVIQLF